MTRGLGRFLRQNSIAMLALFIALSGTTYAATTLAKNSVGTKQLKNNAVISSKIKNNQVTGADVNESSLGKVPSAASADHAANADHATNADNATNASAAALLGGYPANGLTRLGSATGIGFTDHQVTAGFPTFESAGTVTIQAPGPGFVLVQAMGTFFNDRSTCPCGAIARLSDTGAGTTSPHTVSMVASGGRASLTPVWVFPVTAAGSKTYEFDVSWDTSEGLGIFNTSISAFFSPFGGNGTSTGAPARSKTPATATP